LFLSSVILQKVIFTFLVNKRRLIRIKFEILKTSHALTHVSTNLLSFSSAIVRNRLIGQISLPNFLLQFYADSISNFLNFSNAIPITNLPDPQNC
jgi:hypothetical protein